MVMPTRTYSIVAVEGMDGAGKSTLIRSLNDVLSQRCKVMLSRRSRQSVLIFRQLIERAGDDSVLYQDVLPDPFRQAAYIFEASVQFRYLHETYQQHDIVLFDRWQPTTDVYCAPVDEYAEQFRALSELIPPADVLFYVRVDPAIAYQRLIDRNDRWCRTYTPPQLRAKIERLHERYEQVMRDADVTVLDGTEPPERLVAQAFDTIERRVLVAA